ncbi:MAG: hypothetical protein GF364_18310 [Candidatus Lokiarchaeota archaeon]|nr:hypothetical protein [Candidatus Lokiarchaeota archaeon]
MNEELIDLLKVEHATGLQRVDRIPYAFGFEARAPWFDYDIVKFSFKVPQKYKIFRDKNKFIEKYIIRETFKDILPESILLRDKAKFSKGVGSQFYLRNYFNKKISDQEFKEKQEIIPGIFVKNKEELYYWNLFSKKFAPSDEYVKHIPRTAVFSL